MDEFLDNLSKHVHEALKRLKMGDAGTIAITKEFPLDDVRQYVGAYAMHKDKWFEMEYDKTTKTLNVIRVALPNWIVPDVIDEGEVE